jgi:multimeric flavodoxin WrbA
LRNARHGKGSVQLVEEIRSLANPEELTVYLKEQTAILAEEFLAAGLAEGKPFDEVYRTLRKAKGDMGLSNSEAGLVAGLWGCVQEGADVRHVGLASHFSMSGKPHRLDLLKAALLEADGLLISGPVYFGDRSSLIQSFIQFVAADKEVAEHLRGKIYGGISVGAKRNGGQETQLIYQMLDMANLDMLALGNSAETTSQYGGTVVAGDIGTAWSDEYGMRTSIGTGSHLARMVMAVNRARSGKARLRDKAKVAIFLVQDVDSHKGASYLQQLIANGDSDGVEITVNDITQENVYRCIACDVCPTHHAPRDEYSCIINAKEDYFVKHHKALVDADAILLAAYSPVGWERVNSVYQQFVERTRYIRRAHYLWSDRLVAPLVISEVDANQNLHIRMLTSVIRHHTVLNHPIIGVEFGGRLLNAEKMQRRFNEFLANARTLTLARLSQDAEELDSTYNAIGYKISRARDATDHESGRMDALKAERAMRHNSETDRRLEKVKQ